MQYDARYTQHQNKFCNISAVVKNHKKREKYEHAVVQKAIFRNCLNITSHVLFVSGIFRNMWPVFIVAVFFSYLCFSYMLLRCFLNDIGMVQVVLIIAVIALIFTFHTSCFAIVKYLYFKFFSASFYHVSLSWNCNVH